MHAEGGVVCGVCTKGRTVWHGHMVNVSDGMDGSVMSQMCAAGEGFECFMHQRVLSGVCMCVCACVCVACVCGLCVWPVCVRASMRVC